MLFLNPFLLWFLLAAAVPIAIHLLNRRRHKTIQWAAMQFLLKATRESRGKKKLRHILILTCRALAVAALAFAAARPVISGLIGWGGGSIDTVVLLLDRSASMEIRPGDGLDSRRQIIIEKVRDAMKSLGAARLVLIDSAGGKPQEIPSPESLAELSSTAPTDSAADFPNLLTRAAEFLADTPGSTEIWLASDLQASNWRPDDDRWGAARAALAALPQKPAVRVLSLTGPTSSNTSIRLLASRRTGNELLLDLEILRAAESRGNATLPLTTQLNGTRTTENLTLAGQSLRFQKLITLPANSTSGSGWLSIPADGNPRDNSAFYAYGPDRPIRSVIVAPAGEAADYLSLAAAPPGFGNHTVERVDPANAGALNTSSLATILWAAPLPTGSSFETISRFLTNGGHVIFFPPAASSDTALFEMKWSPPAEAAAGKYFILKDWNHSDGPLRDSIDGTPIPSERLKAIRRQIPLGDATSLARWEDGEPFIARRIVDRGTAWFVGSLPDYTWSNLGDADVLLPAVQRVIAASADRFDASYLATVGSEAAQPLPGETRTRIDDYGTRDPANAAYETGIFRLGERLLAINRPGQEDQPEILTTEQLDHALEGTNHTLLDQAGQSSDPSLSRDVWRGFLIAVLLFLIAEAILCLPKKSHPQVVPKKAIP
ncbi:BatA and WFA domain-containing protein [Luteolibacter yonseiensis]|uniref:BatA and WFA domain-containing protein n=1 Tax=Luteolibacter yonseiensis TaxID=1144680 RepID=A0A934R3Y4_9BACT|nr:BatA and WFA domain-containing protein [Luteolibacter yonseiensis]MBK1816417.1 BatA and WFA domain-containing protein [Luteolibacter yonseiensis]